MQKKKAKTPPRPYPTYPLFAHQNGSWTKKIDGAHVRFGPWRWPDAALYKESWTDALKRFNDYLEAKAKGDLYRLQPRKMTIHDLVDSFLAPQHARAEAGQIKPRSFAELRGIVTEFRNCVGDTTTVDELESDPVLVQQFLRQIGDRYGWCAFNKRIKLIRSMWNWAASKHSPLEGDPFEWIGLLQERPIKEFRRQRRREREEGLAGSFTGDEIKALIDHAPQPLLSMVLLAYFAAYGNTDLGEMPDSAMTVIAEPQKLFIRGREEIIPGGWGRLYFPRPKTELDRYCLIPPFVVRTLQQARAIRSSPLDKAYRNRMFLTKGGRLVCYENVVRDPAELIEKVNVVDNVAQPWRRLIDRLGRCAAHGWQVRVPFTRKKEDGKKVLFCPKCRSEMTPMEERGFYVLRHTATSFAAISGASDDTRKIFEGHVDRSNPTRQTFYLDPTQLHDLLLIARELMARASIPETSIVTGNAPAPASAGQPASPAGAASP